MAEEDPESVKVRENFERSLAAVGYDPAAVMDQDAFPPSVDYDTGRFYEVLEALRGEAE